MGLRGRGIPAGGLRQGSGGESRRRAEGRHPPPPPRAASAAAQAQRAALPPPASTTKPAANGLRRGCPGRPVFGHLPPLPGQFPGPPVTRGAPEPPRRRLTYTLPAAGLRRGLRAAFAHLRPVRGARGQPSAAAGDGRAVPAAGSAREATGGESDGTGPSERAAPEPLTCGHLPAALPHSSPAGPAATCGAGPARSRGAKGEASRRRAWGAGGRGAGLR